MKKISYISFLLLLSLVVSSCFSTSGENSLDEVIAPSINVDFDVVKIENLYSMKVPNFMTVTDKLQEGASLQYDNPFKEKYVTVLHEEKDDVMAFMKDYGVYDEKKSALENYADTRLKYLKESGITIIDQSGLTSEKINGRSAYSTNVDAKAPGMSDDTAQFFTYVEGEEHFYTISAWTILSRKDGYVDEVTEMTRSFKEL